MGNGAKAARRPAMRGVAMRATAVAWAWVALAVLGAIAPGASGASAPDADAALDAFGSRPAIEQLTLSPSGTLLAFVSDGGGRPNLGVMRVADRQVLDRLELGERRVVGLDWADDDRLLVTSAERTRAAGLAARTREWWMLQIYDVRDRKLRGFRADGVAPAAGGTAFRTGVVLGRPVVRRTADGPRVLVSSLPTGLYRVSLESGVGRPIEDSTDGAHFAIDAAGEVAAVGSLDPVARSWRVLVRRAGAADAVQRGDSAVNLLRLGGFDAAGTSLLLGTEGDDVEVWRPLSLADGSLGAPLALPDEPVRFVSDRLTGRLQARWFPNSLRWEFVDAERQQRWDALRQAFGGAPIELVSGADDFGSAVVRVDDPARGPSFYLADFRADRVARIGAMYDGLPPLAPARAVRYAAADGLEIPAVLTVPRGRAPERLPLVVLVDDGVAVAERHDPWSQAFAAQGYAVLRPNPRGRNVSARHRQAAYGELGGRAQSDLADGVRWLVSEGVADPARVCIVGRGQGGYAAAAGVTLASGLYRCAVAVGGVFDVPAHLDHLAASLGVGGGYAVRREERLWGVSGRNDARAGALSPARHAERASAPLLLVHGAEDSWSPPEQSREFARALQRAGRPVDLAILEDEGGVPHRTASLRRLYGDTVRFVRRHNPPD
ncbi:MAG: prolyl oligopeptidase family serine peptidase [Steroidobacteraceae bacterium]|jgi:dienelactone hydrolase|nr:prolyl oligopeptidase family serine peptidase [Steroidobacteraceae bacterium]